MNFISYFYRRREIFRDTHGKYFAKYIRKLNKITDFKNYINSGLERFRKSRKIALYTNPKRVTHWVEFLIFRGSEEGGPEQIKSFGLILDFGLQFFDKRNDIHCFLPHSLIESCISNK